MAEPKYIQGKQLQSIWRQIDNHASNVHLKMKSYSPLFSASPTSEIIIIGQAPGRQAQETNIPWNDISGDNLREWMGIDSETFYDPAVVSLLPMDFYYPGKAETGDVPPRKDFASMWHERILAEMPHAKLTILIGNYSQKYYLDSKMKRNLTETVRAYSEYLPGVFPLVHSSPLTGRWRTQNPWFEKKVIPRLQSRVAEILAKNN